MWRSNNEETLGDCSTADFYQKHDQAHPDLEGPFKKSDIKRETQWLAFMKELN